MIVLDFCRRPFRYLFAVLKHAHRFTRLHHDLQNVLDDNDSETEAILEGKNGLEQNIEVHRRQAGRRLIEHQQLWPHCHGTTEREQSALAARQLASWHVGIVGEPDECEQLQHLLAQPLLNRPYPSRAQDRRCRTVSDQAVMSDQHVFEHAHTGKDAQQLEGTRHALTGDLVRLPARDVCASKYDAATRLGLVYTGDQIEERRFAGPVRPD